MSCSLYNLSRRPIVPTYNPDSFLFSSILQGSIARKKQNVPLLRNRESFSVKGGKFYIFALQPFNIEKFLIRELNTSQTELLKLFQKLRRRYDFGSHSIPAHDITHKQAEWKRDP